MTPKAGIREKFGLLKPSQVLIGPILPLRAVTVLQRTTNSPNPEPFDERIPMKYREARTSGFTVTIEEGENSIELKMVD